MGSLFEEIDHCDEEDMMVGVVLSVPSEVKAACLHLDGSRSTETVLVSSAFPFPSHSVWILSALERAPHG